MFWKIYFWINFVLTLFGSVLMLQYSPITFIDAVSVIWSLISLIATYSYAYHKRVFKAKYWKWVIWFIVFLVVESFFEIFVLPPGFMAKAFPILKSNVHVTTEASVLGLVFMLPSVYAIHKLSQGKH